MEKKVSFLVATRCSLPHCLGEEFMGPRLLWFWQLSLFVGPQGLLGPYYMGTQHATQAARLKANKRFAQKSLRNFKQSGEKKTNKHKHKQLRGIVPEMGGGQFCLCVSFFFLGKRETHKQNSQEISEKGRDSPGIIPGHCFFFFSGPKQLPWKFCFCVL